MSIVASGVINQSEDMHRHIMGGEVVGDEMTVREDHKKHVEQLDDFWLHLRQFHVTNHRVQGQDVSILDAIAAAKRAAKAEKSLGGTGTRGSDPRKKRRGSRTLSMDQISFLGKTDRVPVFPPRHKYKLAWDLWLAVLIFQSVCLIPYKIGFDINYEPFFGSIDGTIDLIVDIFFFLDIAVTFNTGYFLNSVYVTNRKMISMKYLKGWFTIDFLSTVPIDIIASAIVGKSGDAKQLRSLKMIRGLRLLRLLKLARLLKLKKLSVILEDSGFFNPAMLKLVSLLFKIVFIAHLLACMWYYTNQSGDAAEFHSDRGWAVRFQLHEAPVWEKYTTSIYWTVATMMAVGYGDIYATNNSERLYSIIAQIIGAFMFGLIIGTVGSVMESADARSSIAKRELEDVVEYCRSRKIPRSLSKLCKAHFEYALSVRSMFDEKGILGRLPVVLRQRVVNHSKKEMIERIPFLRDHNSGFVNLLLTEMKPYLATVGTILWPEGVQPRELYIIRKGLVEFKKKLGEDAIRMLGDTNTVFAVFSDSNYVGGSELPEAIMYESYVARVSDLFMISNEDLHDLFGMFTQAEDKFIKDETIKNAMFFKTLQTLKKSIAKAMAKKKQEKNQTAPVVAPEDRRNALGSESMLHKANQILITDVGDLPIVHNLQIKSRAMLLGEWPTNVKSSKKEKYRVIKTNIPLDEWQVENRLANLQRRSSIMRMHSISGDESSEPIAKQNLYTPQITVEEDEDTLWERKIIFPQRIEKMQWDLIMALCIFYSVVMIPYRICFEVTPSVGEVVLDYFIDTGFVIDMALTFRTAYYDVQEKAFNSISRDIRNNYFKTWFAIDFLSTAPIDTIISEILTKGNQETDVKSQVRMVKLIRGLRLIRLLKLARLLKLGKFMKNVEDYISISPAALKMFKLLFNITFIAHIFACVWFYVSTIPEEGMLAPENNWWINIGIDDTSNKGDADENQVATNLGIKYTAAIYWAFTTMTTVGYGDVTPQTLPEKWMAIIAMILGATIFGFVVGSVSSMVGKMDVGAARLREQMAMIKDYMREQDLPRAMKLDIENFFEFYFQRKSVFDEQKILHDLPPFLRKKVVLFVNEDIVEKLPMFRDEIMTNELACIIITAMQPSFQSAGGIIYQEGDAGSELYFIIDGRIRLTVSGEEASEKGQQITEGGSFGGLEFIMGSERSTRAVAEVYSNFMYLSHTAIDHIIERVPDLSKQIQYILSKYVTLSISTEIRDKLDKSNVLRLSAKMNSKLIGLFGSKQKLVSLKKLEESIEQSEREKIFVYPDPKKSQKNRLQPLELDTTLPPNNSLASPSLSSPTSKTTSQRLGIMRSKKGKSSPHMTSPLRIENSKFNIKAGGNLSSSFNGRKRKNPIVGSPVSKQIVEALERKIREEETGAILDQNPDSANSASENAADEKDDYFGRSRNNSIDNTEENVEVKRHSAYVVPQTDNENPIEDEKSADDIEESAADDKKSVANDEKPKRPVPPSRRARLGRRHASPYENKFLLRSKYNNLAMQDVDASGLIVEYANDVGIEHSF